jgi:hypothetical protein
MNEIIREEQIFDEFFDVKHNFLEMGNEQK